MTNDDRDRKINDLSVNIGILTERIRVMYKMLYAILIFAVLGGISSMWRTYEYAQDRKTMHNCDCGRYASGSGNSPIDLTLPVKESDYTLLERLQNE